MGTVVIAVDMSKKKTPVTAEALVSELEKKVHGHFPAEHRQPHRRYLIEALQAVLDGSSYTCDEVETITPSQMSDTDTGIISQRLVRKLRGYDGSPQKPEDFSIRWNRASEATRSCVYTLMFHVIAPRYPREHPEMSFDVASNKKKKKTKTKT